jgi:hypothetical protein
MRHITLDTLIWRARECAEVLPIACECTYPRRPSKLSRQKRRRRASNTLGRRLGRYIPGPSRELRELVCHPGRGILDCVCVVRSRRRRTASTGRGTAKGERERQRYHQPAFMWSQFLILSCMALLCSCTMETSYILDSGEADCPIDCMRTILYACRPVSKGARICVHVREMRWRRYCKLQGVVYQVVATSNCYWRTN